MLLFGAEVIIARQHFLKHLEGWAADLHQEISLNKESLRLEYVNQLKVSDDTTVERGLSGTFKLYQDNEQREIEQGTTIYGPHRDDIRFLVNDKMCRRLDRKDNSERQHYQ